MAVTVLDTLKKRDPISFPLGTEISLEDMKAEERGESMLHEIQRNKRARRQGLDSVVEVDTINRGCCHGHLGRFEGTEIVSLLLFGKLVLGRETANVLFLSVRSLRQTHAWCYNSH